MIRALMAPQRAALAGGAATGERGALLRRHVDDAVLVG